MGLFDFLKQNHPKAIPVNGNQQQENQKEDNLSGKT
jgi:hypothetical protein